MAEPELLNADISPGAAMASGSTFPARAQQSRNRIWFLANDPTIKGENHEHS